MAFTRLKKYPNSITAKNQTHVYMNCFDHKDLGNHLEMSTSHGSPCMLGVIYYKNVACQNVGGCPSKNFILSTSCALCKMENNEKARWKRYCVYTGIELLFSKVN